MDIIEDLQESIQKNLPAVAASELQSFIEQAKKDAAELVVARQRLAQSTDDNAGLRKRLQKAEAELAAWSAREIDLKAREQKVGDVEHRLKIADLKISHAGDKVAFVSGLFGTVFRNTSIREQVFKGEQAPMFTQVYRNDGSQEFQQSGSQTIHMQEDRSKSAE